MSLHMNMYTNIIMEAYLSLHTSSKAIISNLGEMLSKKFCNLKKDIQQENCRT